MSAKEGGEGMSRTQVLRAFTDAELVQELKRRRLRSTCSVCKHPVSSCATDSVCEEDQWSHGVCLRFAAAKAQGFA